VRPLPAIQRITACLIVRSTRRTIVRMNWVRTCSRTGKILLLVRRLPIGLGVARRRERLPVGAVHGGRLSHTPPDSMSRHKSLCLSGDGSEDAVLVESHAVGAAAVFGRLEARTANLHRVSEPYRQPWK
jgi:hypothetical protein